MRRFTLMVLVSGLCGVILPWAAVLPAAAQESEPAPTATTLTGSRGHAGQTTILTVTVTDGAGAPLPGRTVTVRRLRDGQWRDVGEVVTDAEGRATMPAVLDRLRRDNVFAARHAGDAAYSSSTSGPVQVRLERRGSRLRLRAPKDYVDETSFKVRLTWRARRTHEPVSGEVRLQQRKKGRWRTVERVRTGDRGKARVRLSPRTDVRLRARARRLDWVRGDRSNKQRVDNLPPAPPVQLPRRAPRPRINLPDQSRARGEGANVVVTRIPNGVWRQMTGRSWHRGCPVGRGGLRLVRANYYDYAGYRRRGELVVNAGAVGQFTGALRDIYAAELPIRSMYRVDRFGWSDRLNGADDHRSMAAGNTSAFNCRDVVNNPGVRSPHSWGRAFDINTWENPYHSRTGWVPNAWWAHRSHGRVAWRSGEHRMVEIMRRNGFSWTYGTADSQHFDARTRSGRVVTNPRCAGVCH